MAEPEDFFDDTDDTGWADTDDNEWFRDDTTTPVSLSFDNVESSSTIGVVVFGEIEITASEGLQSLIVYGFTEDLEFVHNYPNIWEAKHESQGLT